MSVAPAKRPRAGKAPVVRGILRELLLGRWKGGERKTEAELSEIFGCSRTPVREALLELAGFAIIELKRNCGAVLQSLGPEEVRDLYAVRQLLEVEATRLATGRLDPTELDDLNRSFMALRKGGRPDRDWKLDQQLHGAIADACGNPRLAAEIARYGTLIQTVRETVGSTIQGIHSPTLQDHLRILDRLSANDPDGAAEAMRLHLEQAADTAVKALVQLQPLES